MENVFGANRKPSNTAFAQQKLKAWQPILTPVPVIVSFLVIGICFIPIAVLLLEASNSVSESVSGYYEGCTPVNGSTGGISRCAIPFPGLDMQPPIYIYYQLENYYQNHRRYVKSRSDDQLRGVVVTDYNAIKDCEPYASVDGSTDPSQFYLPCGLIARSMFNDTYMLLDPSGQPVSLSKDGIAWATDIQDKYNNPPADTPGIRVIPDFKDPDFVVWMRTAALPTFRKLWRIVNVPLKGDYTIIVDNNYPVTSFGGHKRVVITTMSWMGGKNPFLGYAYLTVGLICIVLAIVFAIKHRVSGRQPGDTSYLEWAR